MPKFYGSNLDQRYDEYSFIANGRAVTVNPTTKELRVQGPWTAGSDTVEYDNPLGVLVTSSYPASFSGIHSGETATVSIIVTHLSTNHSVGLKSSYQSNVAVKGVYHGYYVGRL